MFSQAAIKIAKKDLLLFFKDKKAVLLSFLLPIVLISIFVMTFGGQAGGNEDSNDPVLSVLVSDLDSTASSIEFLHRLDSIEGLTIQYIDTAAGRSNVSKGRRFGCLVVHQGFGEAIANAGAPLPVELLIDAGRRMEVGMFSQLAIAELMAFAGNARGEAQALANFEEMFGDLPSSVKDSVRAQISSGFATGGDSGDDLGDDSSAGSNGAQDNTPDNKSPITFTSIVGKAENNFSLIQSVAGTGVMMLLFSVAASGASLLVEKESGTLRKLLHSPISPSDILFGKLYSTTAVSVLQLGVMFGFAAVAFKLDLLKNLPALLLMILATALLCSALGIFLAAICRSRKQVESLSTIVVLMMSAIGGSMVPVIFMPKFIQNISVGTVNYWSIQGFYDIYWRELGLNAILDNVGIMVGACVVLLAISLPLFSRHAKQIA